MNFLRYCAETLSRPIFGHTVNNLQRRPFFCNAYFLQIGNGNVVFFICSFNKKNYFWRTFTNCLVFPEYGDARIFMHSTVDSKNRRDFSRTMSDYLLYLPGFRNGAYCFRASSRQVVTLVPETVAGDLYREVIIVEGWCSCIQ